MYFCQWNQIPVWIIAVRMHNLAYRTLAAGWFAVSLNGRVKLLEVQCLKHGH